MMLLLTAVTVPAQTSTSEATSAVVPNLIKFSGTLIDGRGYPITVPSDVTFSLYGQQTGESKSALWQETQHVSPNDKGVYTVYLGAASSKGLPAEAFTSVRAQWLGVRVEGEPELSRVLLVSVPYALKAGDAQTLGGLPASAFALAGTSATVIAAPGAEAAPAVSPDAGTTVTTTGGTSKYVPLFTGTSTIANSQIYDAGTGVGIGDIPNKFAKLDVNGEMIMRGNMQVTRSGNATSAKGFPSYGFEFFSNVYNSSTKTTANPYFSLQSEPTGNNTSAPSATFNLLFSGSGSAPVETGLSINPSGIIHFASGQTFPGGSGTITGVTAGTGLSGGGTSGTVTLKNTGLLGLTAGTGLTSSGGQSPTVGINTAVVPQLGVFNDFTTSQEVTGGYLWANSDGVDRTAFYAYSTSTDSSTPTALIDNFDSTGAGDLVLDVRGDNQGGECTIDVTGNLFCTGTLGPALKRANKPSVAMYSVTSAENWIEDFGTAKLVNGVAVVHMNPDLAEAISADASYRVFPSPNGDCAGLYVTNRTATTFEVHELQGGKSNVEFDYRIVAHRRGFETVRMPAIARRMSTAPKAGPLHTVAVNKSVQ
jgi:hypothetical protein